MINTQLKAVSIRGSSKYLQKVLDLAQANAATLGFLPKGAFDKYASDNQIIIALSDTNEVLGYLVYGVSQRKCLIYIVHLCVHKSHRRQGIARALFEKLNAITKDKFYGIRVRCRRDIEEASALWPKLGFIAIGEKPGRSKYGSTLTMWWFDHGHPTLFTYAEEHQQQSKLKVVIDANVFFQLQEPIDYSNEESRALLDDWLQEDVDLCLTNEIFNEINRHRDAETRKRERAFASRFSKVTSNNERFQQTSRALRDLFPKQMSVSDESDLRQLAWSIAAGVQFFVTRDDDLLEKGDLFHKTFGIHVIRPADLIINQDQFMRETEYYPARLSGSQIRIERVRPEERPVLESNFRVIQHETKAIFRQKLNHYLSNPHVYETNIVWSADKPLALIIQCRKTEHMLTIPVLRLTQNPISATLARYLALRSVMTASQEKRVLTTITESYLPEAIIDALSEIGFILVNRVWTKANIATVETSNQLAIRLRSLGDVYPPSKQYFKQLAKTLAIARSSGDTFTMLQIEHSLFPMKITDIDLPAFIVPIKPVWAMHLFDSGIANQDLFGGEPSLILSVENVYYRSQRPNVLSAPARVLWYISKGKGDYMGTMSIRACSYIDEVIVDKPKKLFSRFRRLGIYKWEDVLKVANSNIDKKIMAFRFSNTEVFNRPIHRDELQKIWLSEMIRKFHIQSPITIPLKLFFDIYKKCTDQI